MKRILNNKKIIIIAFFIIFVISILIMSYIYLYPKDNIIDNIPLMESNIEEKQENLIKVEIKGAVNNPGVYEITENSRVIDVINLASGLTENADITIINLSKKVVDEMIIIIYNKDQINEYINETKKIEYVYLEKECTCLDNINDACITEENIYATEESLVSNNDESSNSETTSTKININTANIEQLSTLSGIGESKASKIIEYRNTNGNFKNIEDIKNVSGIGDSSYEQIQNQITV